MSLDHFLFRHQLEKGEKIILIVHKHWIDIVSKVIIFLCFGAILPWTIYYLMAKQGIIFFSAWTGLFFLWFLYHYIDHFFDTWICTNVSIIDLEWRGIFHRLSTRISYHEVREISTEINGFWGTVLRYGKISISMATGGQVNIPNIYRPKKIELRIAEIRDKVINNQHVQQADAVHALLSDIISRHMTEQGGYISDDDL